MPEIIQSILIKGTINSPSSFRMQTVFLISHRKQSQPKLQYHKHYLLMQQVNEAFNRIRSMDEFQIALNLSRSLYFKNVLISDVERMRELCNQFLSAATQVRSEIGPDPWVLIKIYCQINKRNFKTIIKLSSRGHLLFSVFVDKLEIF